MCVDIVHLHWRWHTSQQHLVDIEVLAEDVLTEQQQVKYVFEVVVSPSKRLCCAKVVNLDRHRNGNREALRELKKCPLVGPKVWVLHGNFFMKQPAATASAQLRVGDRPRGLVVFFVHFWSFCVADQDGLDAEINTLRDSIKLKTARLCEMEGKADKVSSFFLSPTKPSDLLKTENYGRAL